MKLRWAMFVLAAWLSGTIIISVVAAQNFYTVDRILAESTNNTFSLQVERLGHPNARETLRYLSSELNRLYFQLWNITQLPVGLLLLGLLGWTPADRPAGHPSAAAALGTPAGHPSAAAALGTPADRRARWGVIGMLGIVALMTLWLTPAITSLGRSLDFVPRDPAPPGFSRFWILHGTYVVLDAGKLFLGVMVAIWMSRTK
jgi:hypothetical protein